MEEILRKYAELKAVEKETKKALEVLAPRVKEFILEQKVDKIPTNLGVFSLVPIPVWKYSPAVEAAEAKVDELKEAEKATGIAVAETRYDLKFLMPKIPKENE